jgi:hypothetical protein
VASVIPAGVTESLGKQAEDLLLISSYATVMQLSLHNSMGYAKALSKSLGKNSLVMQWLCNGCIVQG